MLVTVETQGSLRAERVRAGRPAPIAGTSASGSFNAEAFEQAYNAPDAWTRE